ncbi:MAG: hypothetical protein ACFFB5_07460 [Promethearchaeota archaeon]
MSFRNVSRKKIALALLFLIVLGMGIWGGVTNFFDRAATIELLKERLGLLGINII